MRRAQERKIGIKGHPFWSTKVNGMLRVVVETIHHVYNVLKEMTSNEKQFPGRHYHPNERT